MARLNVSLGGTRRITNAKWIVIGVCAVMTLLGGILSAVAYDTHRDGEATKAWPSTSGEILSSRVDQDVRQERQDNGTIRERTTYRADITYSYTIQGVKYTGHRIRADDTGGDRDKAYDTVNEYPVGSIVDVFYDPADPGSSVLRQGADTVAVWMFGGIGGLFVVLGLVGLGSTAILGRGM